MPITTRAIATTLAATLTPWAAAQTVDLGDRASRLSRSLAPAVEAGTGVRVLTRSAVAPAETKVSFGLYRTRAPFGARAVSAPLSLEHTPQGSSWAFSVSSNYVRASAPGVPRLSGFTDVALDATRDLGPFVGTIGLTVPTHGDVGSRRSGQYGLLAHGGQFTPAVSYAVVGSVNHSRSDVPGVSSWTKGIYADISIALVPKQQSVTFAMSRDHTAGSGGSTVASGSYLYALTPDTELRLKGDRGLTEGQRFTTLGFDVKLTY